MKNQVRKIPPKNYVLVGIISVATILFLGYFVFWYKNINKYYENNSIMSGYLSEIKEEGIVDNLTNYLMDNPDVLLYMSFGNDISIKNFENQFKNLIDEYNISSEFIYVDLNLIKDKNFILNIQENFFNDKLQKINLKKQSNILVFENGEIVNILYSSEEKINISDVRRFLVRCGVIKND